ncbi:hypothetical protein E4K67_27750 [Desulfosporosinus fructosivorans]|uniref:Esterase Ig-like N-terminal domain-containing protein n=1 Tax=Desulfosporosinus fructosivorans TaxID=2018669 RepID=A0A4Z0QVW9_9FIRM|nr:hypothetical protein [Desulfosporosinus fructosivorans]TGE34952.1 hypothetical protein E4K67_27750 [Desulfosporosinus fructosivorans]
MKRILTLLLLFSVAILVLASCSQNSANQAAAGPNTVASGTTGTGDTENSHVKSITAINKVFSDGIKTVAVVLEYDKSISTAKLSASAFAVEGKTVTKVYANTEASTAAQGVDGKFVIVELSTDYQIPVGAAATSSQPAGNPPANGGNAPTGQAGGAPGTGTSQSDSAAPSITQEDKTKHPGLLLSTTNGGDGISVSFTQTGSISTVDGETYKAGNTALNNQEDINLIVDDFLKPDFSEPNYQQHYKFNLYVPKDYDKSKSYPLVLFIQDEDSLSSKHAGSLTQGLGGVIWADTAEQAKNECFVLVPSFRDTIVGDNTVQRLTWT